MRRVKGGGGRTGRRRETEEERKKGEVRERGERGGNEARVSEAGD
jgi:hypothetical protein